MKQELGVVILVCSLKINIRVPKELDRRLQDGESDAFEELTAMINQALKSAKAEVEGDSVEIDAAYNE